MAKKDPVCGMEVEETKAKATTQYNKRTYYFEVMGLRRRKARLCNYYNDRSSKAMLPYFIDDFGNPSSIHSFGQRVQDNRASLVRSSA